MRVFKLGKSYPANGVLLGILAAVAACRLVELLV